MEPCRVSYPNLASYTNRRLLPCPICNKPFMAGAEGIKVESDKYEYHQWYCSERCATWRIVTGIKAEGS